MNTYRLFHFFATTATVTNITVAATTVNLGVSAISASVIIPTSLVRYINPTTSAGGDGTTSATSGPNRAYSSIEEFATQEAQTLTGNMYVYASGGLDTSTATFTAPWNTNGFTVYIIGNQVWNTTTDIDTSKYLLSGSGNYAGITIDADISVYINNIGFLVSNLNVGNSYGITHEYRTTSAYEVIVDRCVFDCISSGSLDRSKAILVLAGAGRVSLYNSIINGYGSGVQNLYKVINNTFISNGRAVRDGCEYVLNNIFQRNIDDEFLGGTSADYNLSDITAPGSPSVNNVDDTLLTFINSASDNYHLTTSDNVLTSAGIGPSLHSFIPTWDIDNQVRSGPTTNMGADLFSESGSTNITFSATPVNLGVSALSATIIGKSLFSATPISIGVSALSATIIGKSLFSATPISLGVSALSATIIGKSLFSATPISLGVSALSATISGSSIFSAGTVNLGISALSATVIGKSLFSATPVNLGISALSATIVQGSGTIFSATPISLGVSALSASISGSSIFSAGTVNLGISALNVSVGGSTIFSATPINLGISALSATISGSSIFSATPISLGVSALNATISGSSIFSAGTVNLGISALSANTVQGSGTIFSAGTVNLGVSALSASISGSSIFSAGTVNLGVSALSATIIGNSIFSAGTVNLGISALSASVSGSSVFNAETVNLGISAVDPNIDEGFAAIVSADAISNILTIENPDISIGGSIVVVINQPISNKLNVEPPTINFDFTQTPNVISNSVSALSATIVQGSGTIFSATPISLGVSSLNVNVSGSSIFSAGTVNLGVSALSATVVQGSGTTFSATTISNILSVNDVEVRINYIQSADTISNVLSINSSTIVEGVGTVVSADTISNKLSVNDPDFSLGNTETPDTISNVISVQKIIEIVTADTISNVLGVLEPFINTNVVTPDPISIKTTTNEPIVSLPVIIFADIISNTLITIEPMVVIEFSEYDDFPACPPDFFGNWFQEEKNDYNSEKELFSMLQMEAYNMLGVPMIYYSKSYDVNYNKIWGEDNNRVFTSAYEVMSFYNLPREDKLWSKFGIEGIDEFSMYISKEHFKFVTNNYIPKMSDVIKAKYNSYYYEIVEIKESANMFHKTKQYSWQLVVKPVKIEHINFASTIAENDSIRTQLSGTDIFDVTDDINTRKQNILYNPNSDEQSPNNPNGGW